MSGFGYQPPSAPPAAPPAAPPLAGNVAADQHANPRVAELHTMFPTVETSVIEIILESVGGSQDRAIEQLLSMTDENFKVEAGSTARREAEVDLDEAFARSLALQDQDRMQRRADQTYGTPAAGQPGFGGGPLPYQPRIKRNEAPPAPASGDHVYDGMHGGERQYDERGRPLGLDERYQDRPDGQPQGQPGLLQMEQKLEQFAEVGKQTFNSFLSKAKAKYAEYQASQAQSQQAQGPGQGQYVQNDSSYGYNNAQQQGRNQAQMYGEESAAGWTRTGSAVGGGRGGASNWTREQRSNSRSTSFSSESTFSRDNAEETAAAPKPAIKTSSGRWNPSDSYVDATPPPAQTGSSKVDIVNAGGAGRRSPGIGAGGVTGSPGAKIDASKLGFLPKKKVDLLSTSPSASTTNLAPGSPAAGSAVQSGRNSLDVGGARDGNGKGAGPSAEQHGSDAEKDPNPGLRTAGADIIAKIPPTPPAGRSRFGDDSDDELEYTKNPFDEK